MASKIKSKHQQVAHLEARMLQLVRTREGLSRVQLARELNLSPSTAGIYVRRLVRERFLREDKPEDCTAAGRPATGLLLNPDGGRFIGVDFEARNIMATVVDFSQKPLRRVHKVIRVSDSAEQVLDKIEGAIE